MGGAVPLLFAADEILAVFGIPGGELGLELVEAEIFEYIAGELDAVGDFFFDLFGSAEDVGVILSESADAQQAVHDSGTLVAIDGAELSETHREIAVGVEGILVYKDVAGAVHRLQAILGVVEFHGIEHVLRVVAFVAGGLP